MGGFLQGFVGGVSNSITQQLQQKHQEDQDAKKKNQDWLEKVIFDTTGTFDENAKQDALNQYTKTAGPQAKKFLGANAPLMQAIHKLGGVFGKGGQQGQQQGQPQSQLRIAQGPVGPPAPGTFRPPGAGAPQGYYDTDSGTWVPTPNAGSAAGGGATATVPPSTFGIPSAGDMAGGAGGAGGGPTAKQRFNTPPFFQQPGVAPPGSGGAAKTGDTPIPPERQAEYQDWLQQQSPQIQNSQDYDLQGAFMAGEGANADGHFTDRFKKPNHFTFSTDSQYSGQDGEVGGKWEQDKKTGKWTFYASPTNLRHHPAAELQQYFRQVEPDAKLVLPRAKQRFNATPPPTPPLRVMTHEERLARRETELRRAHELETQWGIDADQAKERAAQEQYDRGRREIAQMERDNVKLTDSQKAEILTGGKVTAAPVPKAIDPKIHIATWKGADGKDQSRDVVWDPEQNEGKGDWVSATSHKKFDIPEDASIRPAPTRAAGGQLKSVPHAVSVANAMALQQQGYEYKDQAGNEMDLSKIPQDMGLQAMVQGDRMFYVPVTPNQATVNVGGEVYAVTPWEKKSIGQPGSGAAALGPSQVGSTTTGQQISHDPVTGQPVAMGGTRQPIITGATPRPAQPAPAMPPTQPGAGAPPAQPGPGGPPVQPGAGGAPRPAGGGAAPAARPPGQPPPAPPQGVRGPAMAGVPQGVYTQQSQQLGPGLVAIGQIFGTGPDDPNNFMAIVAPRLDDEHSRKYMGAAWRFIQKGMDSQAEAAGHANVGGMLGISIGNLLTWGSNLLNIPKMLSESEQREYAKVLGELTPDEKRALNSQINAMSNIAGMRKLSGNLATEASMGALRNDVPTVGELAQSKEEFYDKLSALAREVKNSTAMILPGVWPAGPGNVTKPWVDGLEQYVLDKANAARKKQAAPGGGGGGKYKAGDKRTINGVVYVRDAAGNWNPEKTPGKK